MIKSLAFLRGKVSYVLTYIWIQYTAHIFLKRRFSLAQRLSKISRIDVDIHDLELTLDNAISKKLALDEFRKKAVLFDRLLQEKNKSPLQFDDLYPCLNDDSTETSFDRHYIYHPAWALRVLAKNPPDKHVDISSILYFSSLASAFIDIEFFDYRPAALNLSGLTCGTADLINLPFESESISSLSCMHVIEHVGLGRYGDPLNVDGDRKAAEELTRVLSVGGRLIIVVPVGRPRIQYNAHRIYSHEQVIDLFSKLSLVEHSLIPDGKAEEGLIETPTSDLIMAQTYGCGCYLFTK